MKTYHNNNSIRKRIKKQIENIQHFQQSLWDNFQSELFNKDKEDTFEFYDKVWRSYCAKRKHDCDLELEPDWFKNLAIQ